MLLEWHMCDCAVQGYPFIFSKRNVQVENMLIWISYHWCQWFFLLAIAASMLVLSCLIQSYALRNTYAFRPIHKIQKPPHVSLFMYAKWSIVNIDRCFIVITLAFYPPQVLSKQPYGVIIYWLSGEIRIILIVCLIKTLTQPSTEIR